MSVKKFEKMVADTMRELEKRKALPKFANSAARRYAADYIVKRSVFAPFFAASGITKGCQIARAFDARKENPIEFFHVVVKGFFINWYRNTYLPESCIPLENALNHRSWSKIHTSTNTEYNCIISELRTWQLHSRGITRKIERTGPCFYLIDCTRIKEDVERIMNLPGTPEVRILIAIFQKGSLFGGGFTTSAIPIAAHILSCKTVPAYLTWLDAHYEWVIDCLVNLGHARAWLKEIAPDFSMEIPPRPVEQPPEQQTQHNNRQRRLCTLQHIEEMAIVEQDRIERMIKILTSCECVEQSAWEDHFYGEELLSKINL